MILHRNRHTASPDRILLWRRISRSRLVSRCQACTTRARIVMKSSLCLHVESCRKQLELFNYLNLPESPKAIGSWAQNGSDSLLTSRRVPGSFPERGPSVFEDSRGLRHGLPDPTLDG